MGLDRAAQAAQKIAELSGATPAAAAAALDNFDAKDVIGALAVSGGGNGGSQPSVERVQANTSGPVDPAANPGILNWGHASGDTLLDYTDPTTPTFIAAGVYSITVMVNTGAAQPGEFCNVEFSPGNGDSIGTCIPLADPTGSGDASLSIIISVADDETMQIHLWLSATADPISNVGMVGTVCKLG